MKALVLILAALLAAPAVPEVAVPTPFFIATAAIPQIFCAKPEGGGWTGTGVRIADETIVSARHVTNGEAICSADRKYLLKAVHFDGDFAANTGTLAEGLRMIVSCAGIKEGQDYLGLGYAFGGALVAEKLIGTSFRRGEFVRMKGRVYSGMSGGPVVDSEGRIVAIINQKAEEFSHANVHPLSETYLCGGA